MRSARARAARAGALLLPVGFAGVGFQLGTQALDLRLRLLQALFQRGPATERGGAGTGADPHAVLGHAVEINQVLF